MTASRASARQIRAVLVTRERDFRQQMVAGNYMYPTETLKVRQRGRA
jgi:hypothetical protein